MPFLYCCPYIRIYIMKLHSAGTFFYPSRMIVGPIRSYWLLGSNSEFNFVSYSLSRNLSAATLRKIYIRRGLTKKSARPVFYFYINSSLKTEHHTRLIYPCHLNHLVQLRKHNLRQLRQVLQPI